MNNARRLLSWMAAMGLAALFASVASTAQAACLIAEEFEPGAVGATPAGWTMVEDLPSGGGFVVVDTPPATPRIHAQATVGGDSPAWSGTNAARLLDRDAAGGVSAERAFTSSSVVILEFRLWLGHRIVDDADFDFVEFHLDDAATSALDVLFDIHATDPNGLYWHGASPTGTVHITDLEIQRWYRVRVTADATADSADVAVYRQDDTLLASATGLNFNRKYNTAAALDRFRVRSYGSTSTHAYLDGVAVSDGAGGCAAYAAPPAPAALAPMDGARFPSSTPVLSWNAPSGGPYDYKVQWASGPTFTEGVIRHESRVSATGFDLAGTPPSYTVQAGDALPDGVYWWRVAAHDGAAHSAWSVPRSFTVQSGLDRTDWYARAAAQFARGGAQDVRIVETSGVHDEVRIVASGSSNLALTATASASTESLTEPAGNAKDGDAATSWTSGGTVGEGATESLRLTLAGTSYVSGFDFATDAIAGTPAQFQVRTSSDGCSTFTNTYPGEGLRFVNVEANWSFALATDEFLDCVELVIQEVVGGALFPASVAELRVWDASGSGGTPSGRLAGPAIAFADFEDPKDDWGLLFWNGSDPASAGLTVQVETSPDATTWTDSGLLSTDANGSLDLRTALDPASHPFVRAVFGFTKGSTAVLDAYSVAISPGPTAMPITLTAREEDGKVALRWWVLDERDITSYRVQRRGPRDPDFRELPGSGIAAGTLDGVMAEHAFVDTDVGAAGLYRYRVEVVAASQATSFSEEASIRMGSDSGAPDAWGCRTTTGATRGLADALAAASAAAMMLFVVRRGARPGTRP